MTGKCFSVVSLNDRRTDGRQLPINDNGRGSNDGDRRVIHQSRRRRSTAIPHGIQRTSQSHQRRNQGMKLTMANLRDPFITVEYMQAARKQKNYLPHPFAVVLNVWVARGLFQPFLSQKTSNDQSFLIGKDVSNAGSIFCATQKHYCIVCLSYRDVHPTKYSCLVLQYVIEMKIRNLEKQKPIIIGQKMETKKCRR